MANRAYNHASTQASAWHGTAFGAEALFGEDADLGNPCSTLRSTPWAELVLLPKTGDWSFPEKKKKRNKKQEKEEKNTFCSERTANCGPKSHDFWIKKSSSISFQRRMPPLLRRRRAWLWSCCSNLLLELVAGFVVVLDKCSLHRATPRRFCLSQTDFKTLL